MRNLVVYLLLAFFSSSQLWMLGSADPSDNPVPAKRYTVNLDLPPEERWGKIVAQYKDQLKVLMKLIEEMLPSELMDLVKIVAVDLEKYIPAPYNLEIVGAAAASNLTLGDLLIGNLIYELTAYGHSGSKACTSIVAEAENGTMFHGRNLDYGFTRDFTAVLRNVTIIVDFQQNGKTVYTGTSFVGQVGLVTGQKPNAYTITLNERDQGKWWMNAIEALIAGTHGVTGFLIRDTLAGDYDFESAVDKLAYSPIIAPCYLIVGGTGPRQGAVITRDRISALDVWRLNAFNGHWFLVETNYDHWDPPPTSDDRRDPAIKGMNETGRENLSGPSLFKVLSTPPVLNSGTTYTVIMSAAMPELYNTWVREEN